MRKETFYTLGLCVLLSAGSGQVCTTVTPLMDGDDLGNNVNDNSQMESPDENSGAAGGCDGSPSLVDDPLFEGTRSTMGACVTADLFCEACPFDDNALLIAGTITNNCAIELSVNYEERLANGDTFGSGIISADLCPGDSVSYTPEIAAQSGGPQGFLCVQPTSTVIITLDEGFVFDGC